MASMPDRGGGPSTEPLSRRSFLSAASGAAMGAGLVAGYGGFAVVAGLYVYPSQQRQMAWVYLGQASRFPVGRVLRFQTPAGRTVTITRVREAGDVDDFLALSTVCPHLGCQVHWEAANNRFFCPCHNGVFDPTGKAISGPPAEAGQSLPRFSLRLDNDLIFIHVPVDPLI